MKIKSVEFPDEKTIPWYLGPFVMFRYNSKEVEIAFSVPFKYYSRKLWFAFPEWILDRQMSNCVNYIPDYGNADGTKVKPFFGYVLCNEQNTDTDLKWWKKLKKYKMNPAMVEIENRNAK